MIKRPRIEGYRKWSLSLIGITSIAFIAWLAKSSITDAMSLHNVYVAAMGTIAGISGVHSWRQSYIDKNKPKGEDSSG